MFSISHTGVTVGCKTEMKGQTQRREEREGGVDKGKGRAVNVSFVREIMRNKDSFTVHFLEGGVGERSTFLKKGGEDNKGNLHH